MKPPEFLLQYGKVADERLRAFLETKRRRFEQLPVDLGDAHALLSDYIVRGGKRLRGALVMLGHRAAAGDGEGALEASIGVELLHAYLLIHDDFMDGDDLRRGGPTLHNSLGGDHLGGSLALLLGSLCQAWAYELVLGSGLPGKGERHAAQIMSLALEEVTLGQMADLRAPRAAPLTEGGILALEQLKTGSYTFEMPLLLGAALANGPARVFSVLSAYARPLGQAFQIADDLLGSFGAPEVTGKPNASDLREGKRTLLVARALQRASPGDAAALRAGLGNPQADLEQLREILRRTGAVDFARAEAGRLRDEALRALDTAALPADVALALREIAVYTVGRTA